MPLPLALQRLAGCLPPGLQNSLRQRYRALRDACKLAAAALYDTLAFARGSGVLGAVAQPVLQARILKSSHRLEKGLALAAPRPGYGADAVQLLLDDVALYVARHGADWATRVALQVLDEHSAFNRQHGLDCSTTERRTAALWQRAALPPDAASCGGVLAVSRAGVHAASRLPFGEFARHRYSVRQFANLPVDSALIEEAVRQAQYAPSVCNRQAVQVHWTADAQRAKALLAFQNGNRGFGESAGAVLVITASQAAFHTVGERYQAWIDGGLFAMSLVYALHAQGLGSCCLNWSVEPAVDRAFKAAAGLPAHDAVIMLLAVGHLPEQFSVARSARRPLADVLHPL